MKVESEEIPQVARLVNDLCGLVLDETKAYLIESRLSEVAEESGCQSFAELCHRVDVDSGLKKRVVDAITTQETLFFRDNSPFEALRHKAIPEAIDANAKNGAPKRLRIWSAACSTGQEPYSIAMTLCELIPDIHAWDVEILATDICDAAIEQASLGKYAKHEVQRGLSPERLNKYFTGDPNGWRVKENLRYMIRFDRRNLLQPFPELGPFDVIFCRNVAIYFDAEVKRDLFNRIADRLCSHGYLFTGSAESLQALDPRFVPQQHCRSVFYQPNQRQVALF